MRQHRHSRAQAGIVLVGSILILLLVHGCGGGNGSGDKFDKDDSKAKRGTIGYSALTLTNPFFQEIAESMKTLAEQHGYDLLVVTSERDVRKQADQVDDFIVQGVSAIILNPADSQSIGPAIRKANDAGIPVFTNDLAYSGSEGKVISHIATDNLQGGRLAGQAMLEVVGESGGDIAILHFPQAESCQMRVQGFLEVIQEHNRGVSQASASGGQIRVVATLDGGGVLDEGRKAARDIMEANPNLSAIFAINDPSALGARAALEAAGKADQVRIIGFDGQREGKLAIRDGKIYCDPIQFPRKIGQLTIELMMQYFEGEEVPQQVLIPAELYRRQDALQDPELD